MLAAMESGLCTKELEPFWSLATEQPDLFAKLDQDPRRQTYSIYGFFPGVYERVYLEEQSPQLVFDGRTRGRVAIFLEERLVVKPAQSQREGEIAAIAGEIGAGPVQHPSLPGFLTEELVPGTFFPQLPAATVNPSAMFQVGQELGGILSQLHRRGVYYNDATLCDPGGRSHLLVDRSPLAQTNGVRLIDFGVSLILDRHPNLTLEETQNLVRTLPEYRLLSGLLTSAEAMRQFLEQYREKLAQTDPQEILRRDLRFFDEGIRFAAQRLGEFIQEPLRRGFAEGYTPP